MKKVFITGVTGGIGNALTRTLLKRNIPVWGIARRGSILRNMAATYPGFFYTQTDLCNKKCWKIIIANLAAKHFFPDVYILNAAILDNDLKNADLDTAVTKRVFETNFFSPLEGVATILPLLKRNSQVIAISSISSFKGNADEGIAYASSKSALSIAFESLHQKFKKTGIKFKIVFLGPVATGMNPFSKHTIFTISETSAVNSIIEAMEKEKVFHYNPKIIFFVIKAAKIMPEKLYFALLDCIGRINKRN